MHHTFFVWIQCLTTNCLNYKEYKSSAIQCRNWKKVHNPKVRRQHNCPVHNCKYSSPKAACFFCFLGLIGGVERYIAGTYWGVGSYTRIACSVSTCLAGFVAAASRIWAKIDTPRGSIEIGWEYKSGEFEYTVTLPEGVEATYNGETLKKGENKFIIKEKKNENC